MISQKQLKEIFDYYTQFEIEDPPSYILQGGTKVWINSDKQYHRDNDRPTYISDTGYMTWDCSVWLHRELGPATINHTGVCRYYMYDKEISPRDWFKRIMDI